MARSRVELTSAQRIVHFASSVFMNCWIVCQQREQVSMKLPEKPCNFLTSKELVQRSS
jgi:hypothetical protein